ncbi:MAG: hypothetical protein ACUVTX_08705 [Bacteroidales bacterium]
MNQVLQPGRVVIGMMMDVFIPLGIVVHGGLQIKKDVCAFHILVMMQINILVVR